MSNFWFGVCQVIRLKIYMDGITRRTSYFEFLDQIKKIKNRNINMKMY